MSSLQHIQRDDDEKNTDTFRPSDTTSREQLSRTRSIENDTNMELSQNLTSPNMNTATYRRCMFVRHEENLESCQLIWCDENVHNESDENNKRTHKELLRISENIKLFDNIDECQQFIQQTQSTITYLVCTTSFVERLVLQIHELENIRSIYIYCPNDVDWVTEWIYSKQLK